MDSGACREQQVTAGPLLPSRPGGRHLAACPGVHGKVTQQSGCEGPGVQSGTSSGSLVGPPLRSWLETLGGRAMDPGWPAHVLWWPRSSASTI